MAITINSNADLGAFEDVSSSSVAMPVTGSNITFTVSASKAFVASDTIQANATSASIPSGIIATVSSYSSTSLIITPTGFYSQVWSKTTGTVGTGSKTFTVGVRPEFTAGLTAGLAIRIHHRTSPFTNYMTGTITSFTAATRSLVVNVTATTGTVTQSDWVIIQSGTFTAWDIAGQWGDTLNINNAAILTVTSTPKTKFKGINALTNGQLQITNASTSTPLIIQGNEPTGSNSPTNTGLRFEQNAGWKITGGWIQLGTGSNSANQAFTIPAGVNYPGYVEVETSNGSNTYVSWKVAPVSYDSTILNFRRVLKTEVTNNAIVGAWLFYDPSTRQISCGDGTNGLLIPTGARVRVPNVHLACAPTTPTTIAAAIGDSNCTGSVATGTGSRSFTVATGLSYVGGGTESILLERIGDASYYGTGTVTSYTSGTGAMTVSITTAQSPTSASFSDWRILDQRGFTITSTDSNASSLPVGAVNWWRSGERITATRTGTSMASVTRNSLHADGIPLMNAGDLLYYVADAQGPSGNALRVLQIDTAPSGFIDWTGCSWEWGISPDFTDPSSVIMRQCGGPTMVFVRSSFGSFLADSCSFSAACENAQYNGLRITSVLGSVALSRLNTWSSADDSAANATNLIFLSNIPTLTKFENLEAYIFRRIRSAATIYYDTVFISGSYTPNNFYCIGGQIAIVGCANQEFEGLYLADSPDGQVALSGAQQHLTHSRNSNLIIRKWRSLGSMKLGAGQLTSGDAFSNLIYMHDFDFATGSNATSVTGMCNNSGTSNMVIANANMGTVPSGFSNNLNRATSNLVEKNVTYRNIRSATAGSTGNATGITFSNGFVAEYVTSGQAYYITTGGSVPSYRDTQNYMVTVVPARTTGILSVGPFGGQSALSLYDFTGTTYVNNAGRLYLEADADTAIIKSPYAIRSITSFQNVAPTVVGNNTGSLTLDFRVVNWGGDITAAAWQTLNATNLAAVSIADNTVGINMQVRVTGSGASSGRYLDVIQLATNNNASFQPSVTTFNVGVTGAPNGATLAVYDTTSGTVLRGTATVAGGAASIPCPAELYGATVPVLIKIWLYGYIAYSATSAYYSSSISSAVSMAVDPVIQLSSSAAAALTGLSFASNTLTITANRSIREIYDWLKWYEATNRLDPIITSTDGTNFTLNANVTQSGGNITGTGRLTLSTGRTHTPNSNTSDVIIVSDAGTTGIITLTVPSGSSVVVYRTDGSRDQYVASSGTTITSRVPAGVTGSRAYKVAQYGKLSASGLITVTGGGYFTASVTLANDTAITQATVGTVAAYTQLETLDKVYDYAAYYETTSVGIDFARPFSKAAAAIDAGSRALTIDASLGSVYAYSGAGVSIKASALGDGTTFTSFTTSGAVNYLNGATFNTIITSSAGTTGRFQLNGLAAHNVYVENATPAQVDYQVGISSYVLWIPAGSTGNWRWRAVKYGNIPATGTFNVSAGGRITADVPSVADTSITQPTLATVLAYTTLENWDKIYDYCQAYLTTSNGKALGQFATKNGAAVDLGSYNLIVDATAGSVFALSSGITIKATTLIAGSTFQGMSTTGTIATANGARVDTWYSTSAGRSVLILAPNVLAGSRYQLWNVGGAVEIDNAIAPSGGIYFRRFWTSDITVRLRATYMSGATAKHELEATGVLTNTGMSFLDAQTDELVYNTNGVDGSTCTEFSADYPNVQIDINDPDGVTSVKRLYAWYHYTITTANGIRNFFKAMDAPDEANYTIDQTVVNLKLDNTAALPVRITNGYLSRKDGSTVIAATSGSIQMDPLKAYVGNVTAASLTVINEGVKKASMLIPHTTSI